MAECRLPGWDNARKRERRNQVTTDAELRDNLLVPVALRDLNVEPVDALFTDRLDVPDARLVQTLSLTICLLEAVSIAQETTERKL